MTLRGGVAEASSVEEFRAGLYALGTGSPSGFLSTDAGTAFYVTIRARIAPAIASHVRTHFDVHVSVDEAASLILGRLLDDQAKCVALAERGRNPFAYVFGTCLREWIGAELDRDTYFYSGTPKDFFVTPDTLELLPTASGVSSTISPESGVGLAIADTIRTLGPRTPRRVFSDVASLVEWFAENPERGSSLDALGLDDAVDAFPTVDPCQVAAVANITLGARPTPAETSILGGFLFTPNFNPSTSPVHVRALNTYQAKLVAA